MGVAGRGVTETDVREFELPHQFATRRHQQAGLQRRERQGASSSQHIAHGFAGERIDTAGYVDRQHWSRADIWRIPRFTKPRAIRRIDHEIRRRQRER